MGITHKILGLSRKACVALSLFTMCLISAFVAWDLGNMQADSASHPSFLHRMYNWRCAVCHHVIGARGDRDTGADADSSQLWDGASLGGYASKISVVQGGEISFHISTDVSPYTITIWHEGKKRRRVAKITGLKGCKYDCRGKYDSGCGWPLAYTLEVPPTWPTGVYTVDIPTESHGKQHIVFWVRAKEPGSTSNMLFLSSVNTYHAYNNYGGKSLYTGNSTNGKKAFKVSFDRPFMNDGLGYLAKEQRFMSWADEQGYVLEYATTYDLEVIPDLLDPYDVVVIAFHSEYWTWAARQRLKKFIERGGRLVNLSGNTMWWQIRYEDEGRTLVCYKDHRLDPATSKQDKTDTPYVPPIHDPEYEITGVQWHSGGYTHGHGIFQHEDGYGGYWVQNADHWIFEGTGLQNGDVFGRGLKYTQDVIGNESDGTSFNCAEDGRTITGTIPNTGTPANFNILAIAPVARGGRAIIEEERDRYPDYGFAVMGIYTVPNGGAVFSGSTMGWVHGLKDPVVSQITRNVIDRFLAGNFPKERTLSPYKNYFFYDACNCNNLYHEGVSTDYGWLDWYNGVPGHNYSHIKGDLSNLAYTKSCGMGQGTGLRVTIDQKKPFLLQANLKPDWQGVDILYARMYLDFSNLSMSDGDKFILMDHVFVDRKNNHSKSQAFLKVYQENGKLWMRYSDADRKSGPDYQVPRNRPVLVETRWDKARDLLSLWIDEVRTEMTVDLSGRELISRVDIGIIKPSGGVSGTFCLDELAFDDARIGPLSTENAERQE